MQEEETRRSSCDPSYLQYVFINSGALGSY